MNFWSRLCAALLMASSATLPAAADVSARFEGDALAIYRENAGGRLLRRSDLTPLLRGRPAWKVVVDVAALGRAENKDWHLDHSECQPPAFDRCLLFLKEAGKPGVTLREFDARAGRLIDGGFALPSGPTQAVWYDDTRILIAGNTAPASLTADGVPRLVKLWTRGTPVFDAVTILAAPLDVTALKPVFSLSGGGLFHAAELTTASGDREIYHFGWAQNFRRAQLPGKSRVLDFFQGRAVAMIEEDWPVAGRRYPAGSIVAYPLAPLLGQTSQTIAEQAFVPPEGYGVVTAKSGRDSLYILLRGARSDRLVSVRKGAPTWPAMDVAVPGSGPMTLVAASNLADVALVTRGEGDTAQFYIAGRGRARLITP